jgi:hypothetical protein
MNLERLFLTLFSPAQATQLPTWQGRAQGLDRDWSCYFFFSLLLFHLDELNTHTTNLDFFAMLFTNLVILRHRLVMMGAG